MKKPPPPGTDGELLTKKAWKSIKAPPIPSVARAMTKSDHV